MAARVSYLQEPCLPEGMVSVHGWLYLMGRLRNNSDSNLLPGLVGKQHKVELEPRISGSKPSFISKRNISLKLQSSISPPVMAFSVQTLIRTCFFPQMLSPVADLVIRLFLEHVPKLGKQFQCILCCHFCNFFH